MEDIQIFSEPATIPFGQITILTGFQHPIYTQLQSILQNSRRTHSMPVLPKIYMTIMIANTKCWFILTGGIEIIEISPARNRSVNGIKTHWRASYDPEQENSDTSGTYALVYADPKDAESKDGRL